MAAVAKVVAQLRDQTLEERDAIGRHGRELMIHSHLYPMLSGRILQAIAQTPLDQKPDCHVDSTC